MTKISSQTRDFSQRICPECGAGNGLQTKRMLGKKRAKKECHRCGHVCVVNYETNRLEEYDEE